MILVIGHDSWQQEEVGAVGRWPKKWPKTIKNGSTSGSSCPASCGESEVGREKSEEECVCERFTRLRMNGKLLG